MAPGHKTSNEDKRWLIVGAYHTGVPEKTVARISGLSTTAVRQIYLNHQQTGTPSLPKQLSRRVREKPIVEYDEDGNLIDDNDDSDIEEEEEERETKKRRRVIPKQSVKITHQPTTKDVIAYVVQQVHQTNGVDRWDISSSSSPSLESVPSLASSPVSSSTATFWRPLTPPRDGSHPTTHLKSPSSPPVQFPPSPPQQHQHVPYLPPVGKFDQTIRGCEIWTREDDRILIEHMLDPGHGERWRELEAKLEGRHTAKLCSHRWEYLQMYFLKALDSASSSSSNSPSSSSTTVATTTTTTATTATTTQ
ncbi:hypothetical protein BDA99DRAFT_537451 [Phascolomyces articulosus]|uniref:Myb-like domain-containing protein n=1 Tax=Phascolomyces articulosus TaxID=60185 RepID=A0AAD5KAD3_9FUNG|nr:hypothetical protein BDA99DRAFT_537451 [Phascolomyces articulosus]